MDRPIGESPAGRDKSQSFAEAYDRILNVQA